MHPVTISKITARRFVLGRQGLWPGRRWQGVEGTASALRVMEGLQLDPLNVAARSQDIALWGRVIDYSPAHLDQVAYRQREFFDYRGRLSLYPMRELPYWGVAMQRLRQHPRWQQISANTGLLQSIRDELHRRGPLGNRDFAGTARVNSYRGRKDSALALYWMWLVGEVMIHHRQGFDRRYALRSQVAPPAWDWTAEEGEAEAFFSRKSLAFYGLAPQRTWANDVASCLQRWLEPAEDRARLERLVQQGAAAAVQVEGMKGLHFTRSGDLELLETLEAGAIPPGWQPLQSTSLEQAVFLAPLDIVSARGRAKQWFDFDYTWEVYKPASQRRWGYYTLPVLYGDRLEARLDPRLERASGTLWINGFWLEEHAPAQDPAFAAALARGLQGFAAFVGARQVDFLAPGAGPDSPDQAYLQHAWQSFNGGG